MPAAPEPGAGRPREVFQYALLRVVPDQERGEGLNVAVVVHCRRRAFLGVRTHVDPARLAVLDPTLDLAAIAAHLRAVEGVAAGDPDAGAVAAMDRSDRFGWITAPSSTILQPSPVHTGVCDDPDAVLERLARRLVAPPRPAADAGAAGDGAAARPPGLRWRA
ncbi:DUF3037 domain-containing protein [Patulibacter brassicae]|uniref:DUF3037 domain-containing protein n=1 Tax=Patulibacter brassicae TaxID=1705717 RepID=A0ABU4VRN1_9ACTN|nr:DUF3037 domain-containing protein [Patulibacter brassicae]MDX8153558.1 DUF3037 domain-containing protein [Patulibacter brassicae]